MESIEGMIVYNGERIEIPFDDTDMFFGFTAELGYRIERYIDDDILISDSNYDN